LEGEPGLAGSGWSSQRQQPCTLASEQGRDLAELTLAPQEGRRRNREVRLLQACQRREGFAAKLKDAFRCGKVFQTVLAEVAQAVGLDQGRRRRRDQDLPASWSAYASAPNCCRSLVEPSMSVKTKVTVPVGSSRVTDQFKRAIPIGVDPPGPISCWCPAS
jgi:hypothetical protein